MDGAAGGPMLVLVLAHSRRAPHPRRPWSPYRGLLRGLGTAIPCVSRVFDEPGQKSLVQTLPEPHHARR